MAVEEFAVRSQGPRWRSSRAVDDRDAAEALRGVEVAVTREELGEADEGSIYWIDLVGLEVVDLRGEGSGEVDGLFETGETSVLVVKGERERMIPFVAGLREGRSTARRSASRWTGKAEYDV